MANGEVQQVPQKGPQVKKKWTADELFPKEEPQDDTTKVVRKWSPDELFGGGQDAAQSQQGVVRTWSVDQLFGASVENQGWSPITADDLPEDIFEAVIQQESAGDPDAVSNVGARGLLQVMPTTAFKPGYGVRPAEDWSKEEFVRVGREYLANMMNEFEDVGLALAAYNAGPGRVKAWLRSGDIGAGQYADIPFDETRNYVSKLEPIVSGILNPVEESSEPKPMQMRRDDNPALVREDFSRRVPTSGSDFFDDLKRGVQNALFQLAGVPDVIEHLAGATQVAGLPGNMVGVVGDIVRSYGRTFDVKTRDVPPGAPWYDLDRISATVGENLPLLAALGITSYAHPALGLGVIAGVEGGNTLHEIEAYERQTGEKVDPLRKNIAIVMSGAINAALERYGIKMIGRVAAPGMSKKLIGLLIAAGTEGGIEAVQALTTEISKFFARLGEINVPENIGQIMAENFYAGMLLGLVGGIVTGTLGTLAHDAPNPIELERTDPNPDGTARPLFRINQLGEHEGKLVGLEEAESIGFSIPDFGVETFRRAALEAGVPPGVIDLTLRAVEGRANKLGITKERLLTTLLVGVRKNKVSPTYNKVITVKEEVEVIEQAADVEEFIEQSEEIEAPGDIITEEIEVEEEIPLSQTSLEEAVERRSDIHEAFKWDDPNTWVNKDKDLETLETPGERIVALENILESARTAVREDVNAEMARVFPEKVFDFISRGRSYFSKGAPHIDDTEFELAASIMTSPGMVTDKNVAALIFNQVPDVIEQEMTKRGIKGDQANDIRFILMGLASNLEGHLTGDAESYIESLQNNFIELEAAHLSTKFDVNLSPSDLFTFIKSSDSPESLSLYNKIFGEWDAKNYKEPADEFVAPERQLEIKQKVKEDVSYKGSASKALNTYDNPQDLLEAARQLEQIGIKVDKRNLYNPLAKRLSKYTDKEISGDDAISLLRGRKKFGYYFKKPRVSKVKKTVQKEGPPKIVRKVTRRKYDSPDKRTKVKKQISREEIIERPAFSSLIEGVGRVINISEKGFNAREYLKGLANIFMYTLTDSELALASRNFGGSGVWTDEHANYFVQQFVGWLEEGAKTKKVTMQPVFNGFRDWIASASGADADVKLNKNTRAFLRDMFDNMTIPPRVDLKGVSKYYNRLMGIFDVEGKWKQIGQPKTGFAIKNFASNQTYAIEEAKGVALGIMNTLFGRNIGKKGLRQVKGLSKKQRSEIADVILTAESIDKINLLRQKAENGDASAARKLAAVNIFRQYFDRSKDEFIRYGALEMGFVEHLKEELQHKLEKELSKGDKAKAENLDKILTALEEADNIQFVHIPFTAWFMEHMDKDPARALLALNVLKARKTPTIAHLIDAGVIDKTDLNLADILASYGRRKGRDIAALKILDAAIQEGAATPLAKGGKHLDHMFRAPREAPVFKDYQLNSPLHAWVRELTNRGAPSSIRRLLNYTKMAAFWNPLTLNQYNMIQLSMGAALRPKLLPPIPGTSRIPGLNKIGKHWRSAWNDVRNRTPKFFEAEEFGIQSQPFADPYENVHLDIQKMEQGYGPAVVRHLFDEAAKGPLYALKDIANAPFGMVHQLYQLSWTSAWWFDRLGRQVLYNHYTEDIGMSPKDAAQLSAKIFGDYASVPDKTRRELNVFLFTPTYKIAMGKLFMDSLGGMGNVLQGNATKSQRQLAGVIVRGASILLAYDMFMTALGWERDQFGRRYSKNVTANPKNKQSGLGPKELVVTWGGPHDLFYKMYLRAHDAWSEPGIPDRMRKFFYSFRWEVHPLFLTLKEVIDENKDLSGRPITQTFDPTHVKAGKVAWHMLTRIVQMFRLIGEDDLNPQGRALLTEQIGHTEEIISSLFFFAYSREIKSQRIRNKLLIMAEKFGEETGMTTIRQRLIEGISDTELLELLGDENRRLRQDGYLREVKAIIDMMEEDFWNDPDAGFPDLSQIPDIPFLNTLSPEDIKNIKQLEEYEKDNLPEN